MNRTSPETVFLEGEKQTVDKKKKKNIPSLILFIPFPSKLFYAGFSGEKPRMGRDGKGAL